MATVDKNFRIKHGLVVEGSIATVNGENILREGSSDSYIINLIGGSATSNNTPNTVVLRDANGDFSAGTITASIVGDVTGTVSDISNHSTSNLSEGSNLYFTNQRAVDAQAGLWDAAGSATTAYNNAVADAATDASTKATAAENNAKGYADSLASNYDAAGSALTAENNAKSYAESLASNYDPAGSAVTAQGNAESYTDSAINALETDDIEEGLVNLYFTDSRARAALSSGTGISYNNTTGEIAVDSTVADKTYVDTAINNLIDGAPGLLDTLNEIAAAINDDANYFTNVANAINAKQDTLTAGANIDITNSVISVTGLDTDDVAEATNLYFTDQRARDAITGTTPSVSGVDFGWYAKDFANYTWIANGSQATVATWPLSYASAKVFVHMRNGSHSQASEVTVVRDSNNNIGISEYGIVTTNGSLGDITASVSGSDIILQVTPTHTDGTDVAIKGSAVVWWD